MQSVEFMRQMRKCLDKNKSLLDELKNISDLADNIRGEIKKITDEMITQETSLVKEIDILSGTDIDVCNKYYDLYIQIYDNAKLLKAKEGCLDLARKDYDAVKIKLGDNQRDIIGLRKQIKEKQNSISVVDFIRTSPGEFLNSPLSVIEEN